MTRRARLPEQRHRILQCRITPFSGPLNANSSEIHDSQSLVHGCDLKNPRGGDISAISNTILPAADRAGAGAYREPEASHSGWRRSTPIGALPPPRSRSPTEVMAENISSYPRG